MLALLLAAPFQTTWIVDETAAGPGQGTAGDPYASVTYALQQPSTVSGDTVLVRPGLYANESIDFLGKAVVIRSAGGPSVTRLVAVPIGQVPAPVVRAASGEGAGTRLEGFTIEGVGGEFGYDPLGGAAGFAGAGVLCVQSSLELQNLVITGGGEADYGSGVYIEGGSVRIEDVTFTASGDDLTTKLGGGLFAGDGATVELRSCAFEANEARWYGGAIALHDSSALIVDTAFRNHLCTNASGAAIGVRSSTVQIDGCTFTDNVSGFGGGAIESTLGGTLVIERSTFASNLAGSPDPYPGGAIRSVADTLVVRGCSFTGGQASDGGAIYTDSMTSIEDSVFRDNIATGYGVFGSAGGAIECNSGADIRRCVFEGNRAVDVYSSGGGAIVGDAEVDFCTFVDNAALLGTPGTFRSGAGGRLTNSIVIGGPVPLLVFDVRYCNVSGGAAGRGNIDVTPEFWGPQSDLRLLPDSPCIDAGDPTAALDADGTRADMGAFPFDPYVGASMGTSTCSANVNSTGAAAELTARGSVLAPADRVTLHVEQAPSAALGYFLASRVGGMQVLGGGSQGVLCLGGSILRFSATVLDDRGTGVVSFRPRVDAFPQGNVVLSGDRWTFQYWFRDANPQSTSNTSSAVEIVFQ